MNIYDVSQKAGFSIATVSRVINGNQNVSEKTKQKVLDVMKEIGYTPNVFARGLGLNTMQTIGIMCSDSSDTFLANAVYHLEQNLRKNGYDSFLCCTGYDLHTKQKYLKLLLSKRVDAIVMVGSGFLEPNKKDNAYILEAAEDMPIMLINGYLNHPRIYCTLCDDYQAVYDSVNKLIDQGRKRVLYLYNSKTYSSIQKLNGYKAALAANDIDLDENLIQMCPNTLADAHELLTSLATSGLKYNAVVTSEDLLAIGAIKFIKQAGRKIPEDCSVIGYNNSLLASCCDPELTSIDNHVETLCISTISTLMRVLSGNDVPNKTTISNDLIVRETTNF
ncbi:MAG: LacI family DNA-binding transcriptional regulator [Clostridiales bacterium]|nr:LacI family DNA-binding transcriptional regulator [Clostridiales bacterium]